VDDIPLLVEYFISLCEKDRQELQQHNEQDVPAVSSVRLAGNIRELQNVIERAVILCDGGNILG